jgi:hypothetical protein
MPFLEALDGEAGVEICVIPAVLPNVSRRKPFFSVLLGLKMLKELAMESSSVV